MPNWAGMPNPTSYKDLGDGTIYDNVTGLTWEKTVGLTTAGPYEAARAYCAALTLAGAHWRVPTRIEMVSLWDFTACVGGGPCINPTYFPNSPQSVWYWTSSVYAGDTTQNFLSWSGEVNTYTTNRLTPNPAARVRCVH